MSNIIILDEITKNQIAAGEVVERPVSVVKELVENSLDACSKHIIVDIYDGGLTAITVTDDGCGMTREDIELAFHRHATSKIRCASDLNRITTLGFRGEALPSIAAVSRVSVITRTEDSITGTVAELEGGSLISVAAAGCPVGTAVTVRELFYNTPVRKKTMKNPASEGALCADLISRLSLARPDVCFEMNADGRRVFYSPGTNSLIDSASAVYGASQAREMIFFESEREGLIIKGLAGKPSLNRSTRNHITIIINGRYVRCQSVLGAVEEAYRTLLPAGRKPVAVLSLNISPELTDVNVHPSKLEVRLLEEEKLLSFVTGVIRQTLRVKDIIPSNIFVEYSESRSPGISREALEQATLEIEQNTWPEISGSLTYNHYDQPGSGRAGDHIPQYFAKNKTLPVLHAAAQLPPVYILAGGEDGLYIVDQHAAHERILFEEYMVRKDEGNCQYLLVPVTLELDYREAAILIERVLWFTDFGFVIEHFGGNTFLLRGVPQNFPAGQEKEIFLDLLDYLREKGPGLCPIDFSHKIASSMACRSAVKAGEKLSQSAMNALLQRLAKTENPFTCPHGRPTIIFISYTELNARFKR